MFRFPTSLFGEHKDASKSQGEESFDRRPVHAVPPLPVRLSHVRVGHSALMRDLVFFASRVPFDLIGRFDVERRQPEKLEQVERENNHILPLEDLRLAAVGVLQAGRAATARVDFEFVPRKEDVRDHFRVGLILVVGLFPEPSVVDDIEQLAADHRVFLHLVQDVAPPPTLERGDEL